MSPGSTTSTATGAPISPSGHRSQRTPAVGRSAAPGSSRRQAARSCTTGREQIGGGLRSGRSGKVLYELFGDEADCWYGWHIRRAPDPDGLGRAALLISSLRHPVDGNVGVGVLDLYVLRRGKKRGDQGTTTRGSRRSDIR